MYEAKQNKEKVSRRIDGGGWGWQKRSSSDGKNILMKDNYIRAEIQRKFVKRLNIYKSVIQCENIIIKNLTPDEDKYLESFMKSNYPNGTFTINNKTATIKVEASINKFKFRTELTSFIKKKKEEERERDENDKIEAIKEAKNYATSLGGTPLKTDGKRNVGIYQTADRIIKLVHYERSVGNEQIRELQRYEEQIKKIEQYKNIYTDAISNLEINTPISVTQKSVGDHLIHIIEYKKQPGETVQENMKTKQNIDFEYLGKIIASFHFSPSIKQKSLSGNFLYHSDLNASNILISDNIIGLIDTDDVQIGTEQDVINDISYLITDIKNTLKEGSQTNIDNFLRGYSNISNPYDSNFLQKIKRHIK